MIIFSVQKRASGWAVVRDDGQLIAIGFVSKKDAETWLNEQLATLP